MRKEVLVALLIVLFLVGLGVGYVINLMSSPGRIEREVPVGLTGEVRIGVLVDLSGALTRYGEDI
ncbi:MAG: hypothetical protein QXE14_01425 [Candidatus Bathyarchaeia archaeon]